jgi:cerevisin
MLTCVPQVRNAINNKKVPFVVSAGNGPVRDNGNDDGEDVVTNSPGRVEEAIVVGATTIDDKFASYSNFGKNVDILAPGDQIFAAGHETDDDEVEESGSSQAA